MSQPTVDVVIIGLNTAKTLGACIGSVRESRYPSHLITVIYADGGSRDGSADLARSLGAEVVVVESDAPTPGRQRNAGWALGRSEVVQFLDSDTVLDPDWLPRASEALVPGVAAVCGDRKELHPEATVFNWLGDQEWNGPAGDAEAFGGDVFVRRSALEASGGYNPGLIAGEDPELAHRIRLAGHRIVKLDVLMTRHDLAMKTLKQYWRRAYRTGHAYAEVQSIHRDFWDREVRRIVLRGVLASGGVLCLLLAPWAPWLLAGTVLGTAALLLPRILRVARFQSALGLSRPQARLYSWHAALVVVPQFFGVLRYYMGRLVSRPLTNKRIK